MSRRPQAVCAGCREPTTPDKAICDRCAGILGEALLPCFCPLCEAVHFRDSPVLEADSRGIHRTSSGGYAGLCAR